MNLTHENYRTPEAELHYMSNSQFSSWLECEARQVAKLAGEWVDEKPTTFLVGSFVHAWCEGALSDFTAEHPEMFKKDGTLKADFQHALTMIRTLELDPFAMMLLQGQKEVIMTAELFGVPWKAVFDVYVPCKRIVDLKTTKSIRDLQWNDEHRGKVTFIEQYHYFRQVAVYSEVERLNSGGDWLDFYMVAVSKQDVPDKEVINLTDPDRVAVELASIGVHMPRIIAVKEGRVEPFRCGACDYCRATKHLTRAVHYMEIGA